MVIEGKKKKSWLWQGRKSPISTYNSKNMNAQPCNNNARTLLCRAQRSESHQTVSDQSTTALAEQTHLKCQALGFLQTVSLTAR